MSEKEYKNNIEQDVDEIDLKQSLLSPTGYKALLAAAAVDTGYLINDFFKDKQAQDDNDNLSYENQILQGQLDNMTANYSSLLNDYTQSQSDNSQLHSEINNLQDILTNTNMSYEEIYNIYNETIIDWNTSNNSYLQDISEIVQSYQDMMNDLNISHEQQLTNLNSVWQNLSAQFNLTAYDNGRTLEFGVAGFDYIWDNLLTNDERMEIMDIEQYDDLTDDVGLEISDVKVTIPGNSQGEDLINIDSKLDIYLSSGDVRTINIDTDEALEWEDILP